MKKAIIVDLDGTLCDCEHRVHHVSGDQKDWESFNTLMEQDRVNSWCLQLMSAMKNDDHSILIVTGREDAFLKQTECWLEKNHVYYDHLYMRPTSSKDEDSEIKKQIYDSEIKDNYDVTFVVEDRKSVVKMWRELGLVCLQCDWGEF